MATSSDRQNSKVSQKSLAGISGDHWDELTESLCRESTDAFGQWLGEDLNLLIDSLDRFVSPPRTGSQRRR